MRIWNFTVVNLGTAIRDLSELIIHKELIEQIMEIVSLYKQEWQETFLYEMFWRKDLSGHIADIKYFRKYSEIKVL